MFFKILMLKDKLQFNGFKLAAIFFVCTVTILQAQQITLNVSAQFNVSPYISDWAADPTLAQIDLISFSETEFQVFLQVEFIGERFGQVLYGESSILNIPAGENLEVIQSTEMIDWSNVSYEGSRKDFILQSGRLPEDYYQIRVSVLLAEFNELISEGYGQFDIFLGEGPSLIYPICGEEILNAYPSFQWSPAYWLPEFQIYYELKIVEILDGQTPYDAIESNIPLFEYGITTFNYFDYGPEEFPLENGKRYAWQVQATDEGGYPIGENDGKSEICDFTFASPKLSTVTRNGTTIPRPGPHIPKEIPEKDTFLVPGTPPPTFYPEELTSEEQFCCGIEGSNIFYPITSHYIELNEQEQQSRRNPAAGAYQVYLHNGAFYEEKEDLRIKSVGIPFSFKRYYKGHINTRDGGFIGSKWTFNFDKQIVALAPRYTSNGLFMEQMNVDKSIIKYYDGTGRMDTYFQSGPVEYREIHNFQKDFKAYVTTYKTPDGGAYDFHEIQRYILADDEQIHPFDPFYNDPMGDHPNVFSYNRIFYVVRENNGTRYAFNCRGQLIYWIDRNDNKMRFEYLGGISPLTQSPALTKIYDTANRLYLVETADIETGQVFTNIECKTVKGNFPIPRLKSITDFTGRKVVFDYKNNDSKMFLEVARQEFGGLKMDTRYKYSTDSLITEIQAPENFSPYLTLEYTDKKVNSLTLGKGIYRLKYLDKSHVDITDPNGNIVKYTLEPSAFPKVVIQEEINDETDGSASIITSFSYNSIKQLTEIKFPNGNKINYDYDQTNEPITQGDVRNYKNGTYLNNLSKGNLLSIVHATNDENDLYPYIVNDFEYENLFNQKELTVNARGLETRFVYNNGFDKTPGDNGNPIEKIYPDLTRPDGSVIGDLSIKNSFNLYGQIESVKDTDANLTTYKYNPDHYLSSINFPIGQKTFVNDARGNVIREIEPGGKITEYKRDERDLTIEQIEDPDGFGNKISFKYDLNGNLKSETITIKDNFVDYNNIPKPKSSRNLEVVNSMKYDILNRLIERIEDQYGFSLTKKYSYDPKGNQILIDSPSPSGTGRVTTEMKYNSRDLVLSVTEAKGTEDASTVNYKYDKNGNIIEIIDPNNNSTKIFYDGFDRVIRKLDPNGTITYKTIDPNDNIKSVRVVGQLNMSGDKGLLRSESFLYDEYDNIIQKKIEGDDGQEVMEEWYYNRANMVEKSVRPNNQVTRFKYDAMRRIKEKIDAAGNIITSEYDEAGNIIKVTENLKERVFDSQAKRTDESTKSFISAYNYDILNRPTKRVLGSRTSYVYYNSMGHVRGTVDEMNRLTETEYDEFGRSKKVIRNGVNTQFTYYSNGPLKRVKTLGDEKEYEYDNLGRIVKTSNLTTGNATRYLYDKAGNKISMINPRNDKITYKYNSLNLNTEIDIDYSSVGISVPRVSLQRYSYDGIGRVIHAENNLGSEVKREYDAMGNIRSDIQTFRGEDIKVSAAYSSDLSKRTLNVAEFNGVGLNVDWTFDQMERINSVLTGGQKIVDYYYSGIKRISSRYFSNLFTTHHVYNDDRLEIEKHVLSLRTKLLWTSFAFYKGSTPHNVREIFYDGYGRILESNSLIHDLDNSMRPVKTISRTVYNGSGDEDPFQIENRVFRRYNDNGKMIEYTTATLYNEAVTFLRQDKMSYNLSHQINKTKTDIKKESISLSAGDLNESSIENALAGYDYTEDQNFKYDKNGQVTEDTKYEYYYDYENRISYIRDKWSSERGENESVAYYYDPFGRRIYQEFSPKTPYIIQRYKRQDIRFVYDGMKCVLEIMHPANSSEDPKVLAKYIYGALDDELVRMDRRINDNINEPFKSYYVYQGINGGISFLSDDEDIIKLESKELYGLDELVVQNSMTKFPYVGVSNRKDSFSGLTYLEQSSAYLLDYKSAPYINFRLDMDEFREKVLAETNRLSKTSLILMAVLALPAAPLLPAAAWIEGAISVAFDYGITSYLGGDYSFEQGMTSFALGALGGGIGQSLKGISGLSKLSHRATQFGIDFSTGTIVDLSINGDNLSDALYNNFLFSGLSAIGPLCFEEGTRIMTNSGIKEIQNIEVGDSVLSRNMDEGIDVYKPVLNTYVTNPGKFVHLEYLVVDSDTTNGYSIIASIEEFSSLYSDSTPKFDTYQITGTPGHPVWSVDREDWINLEDLISGEKIFVTDHRSAVVINKWIELAEEDEVFTAYNFSVEDNHNYYILPKDIYISNAALLVHNKSGKGKIAHKPDYRGKGYQEIQVQRNASFDGRTIEQVLEARTTFLKAAKDAKSAGGLDFYFKWFKYDHRFTEALGEIAAITAMQEKFAHWGTPEIIVDSGPNTLDIIFKFPKEKKFIIIEAKGGNARLGSRIVDETTKVRARQGTMKYLDSVLEHMEGKGKSIAQEIKQALKADPSSVRYFLSKTPVPKGTGPLVAKIREFKL